MKMNQTIHYPNFKNIGAIILGVTGFALSVQAGDNNLSTDASWLDKTISPVSNPIYFEDPRIDSEIRPVFLEHRFPSTYEFNGGHVPLGGDLKAFAIQARLKITDRLAFIATKDGYIASTPDNTLSHTYGWGNVAGGLKYAVIDDRENEFILTPGFTIEVPVGNTPVFQGHGAGLWNVFASGAKGWGDFHVTANAGALIPNNWSQQTAELHYSVQLDYFVCKYFIPCVSGNAYTVLSEGNNRLLGAVNVNKEFNDLTDFGATRAAGTTQFFPGVGFRSHLTKDLDVGFAYEYGLTHPQGIFKDRFTVDMIWRF